MSNVIYPHTPKKKFQSDRYWMLCLRLREWFAKVPLSSVCLSFPTVAVLVVNTALVGRGNPNGCS